MHSIRLRGPWRYEVVERIAGDASRPASGKQQMPADWGEILGSDFRGTVRYRRTFHQPTGLELGQAVWLVIEGVTSHATVVLNGTPLPACGLAVASTESEASEKEGSEAWRHEVRHLLSATCELMIDVTHPAEVEGTGGLTGEVRLEIQAVRPRPVE